MGSSIASSLMDPTQYYSQFISLQKASLEKAKTPYQNQISSYQSRIDLYASLKNALSESLKTMSSFTTYESKTKLATSSNETSFTVSSTSSSVNGSYSIEVQNLATADTYNKAVPDIEANIGVSGTIKINGKEIKVDADSSMKNVMNSINSAGAKVNIYTLGENMVVTSSTTGVENSIKFEGDSAVLDALGLVQNSPDHLAAEDAKLRINGATVTSATNKVTNYIPGVTINLKKETTGAEKLTIQDQSDEKAASMITSFVNTYNALTSTMKTYTGKGTILQASAADLEANRALNNVFQHKKDGNTLFDFGISVDKEGVLKVDETAMKKMVAEDPTAVERFFFGIGGIGDELYQSLNKTFGSTGFISDETTSMTNEINKLNLKLTDITSRNDTLLTNITDQYNKWLEMMQAMQSDAMTLDALIDGMNSSNK